MNVYLIIPFIAFCIQLVAIVYGLALKKRGRLYVAFIILSTLYAGWALTDLLLWLPVPLELVDPILRIQIPFYAFTGVAYLYMVYAYLHRTPDFPLKFFITISVVAVLSALPTDIVVSGFIKAKWGYTLVPGPMHIVGATIGAVLPFLIGVFLLVQRTLVTQDKKEKTELAYYCLGTILVIVSVFTAFIVMPQISSISVQPLVHVVIAIFQILNIYAIFRYQLFSIGIQTAANDLFSDATDGIVILSNSNRIVQANPRAVEILANDFPDSLEVTVRALLTDLERNHDTKSEFEVEVERENDVRTCINLTLSPVMHAGEQTGWLLQIRDVTSQKRAKKRILDMNLELQRARDEALGASQSKSRFLANMSHELRTPLNAIIGYSEMIKEQLENTDNLELANDMDRIHIAGNHLLAVINNILDLSKIEAGKIEVNVDTFTIGGLARMVSAMVEPSIKKNGNIYTLECPDDIGDMQTDIMKLRQCLINILGNAGRFTKNGNVELAVSREAPGNSNGNSNGNVDVINFAIRDTGIGIKPENLGRIFETFSQADDTTTRVYGGSGLGLAISKRLVEMLGGEISVDSETEKGSCFTLRIPAIYQPPTD